MSQRLLPLLCLASLSQGLKVAIIYGVEDSDQV